MLTFNGAQMSGFHGPVIPGKPMLQTKRTKFAGIIGESEIRLGSGGRPLACQVWLNSASYTSPNALAAALDQMDGVVGVNSDLVETGNVQRTWSDCTFEGFVQEGPMLPVVGGIGMNAGTWFVVGTLHFYQLLIG